MTRVPPACKQMTNLDDDAADHIRDGKDLPEEKLEQMKRAFTEVVSHELNTPVAIILGYTSLLTRHLPDEESTRVTNRALEGLTVAAERLESISDRIFKMLSDEGRSSTLQLAQVEVTAFLEDVRSHIQGFLDARNQTVDIHVDASSPGELTADPDKLHDILVNLLMNAIKFSRDGQTIRLEATGEHRISHSDGGSSEPTTPVVCFVVEDNGIGINSDDIDQIFEAFFSTMQTRHHSSGEFEFGKRGIGLGLPIARDFARMHGGDIVVESERGEGSRFTVQLPVEPQV